VGSLPKFLDDPFKKVSYSFRIEENLLNKVKLYAKATERKLPETFNYLIRESLKGCNLDNTYLNEFEGTLINITYINPAYNDYGEILENYYRRGSTNYLDLDDEGFLYEVKKIPNNLDVWHSKGGYFSNSENLIHEGISLVIVPEIVYNDYFKLETPYLRDCLKYIYFSIDTVGDLEVKNISYKEAFRKLKEVGNNEVLYNFKNTYQVISDFINDFVLELQEDQSPNTEEYTELLYSHFVEFANTYNDVNINSLDDMKPVLKVSDVKTDTKYINQEKDLIKIIDDLKRELEEKDKAIKQYEERRNKLDDRYKDIIKRLDELESKRK
jgi:uncharacterized protein (DUF885 family)